MISLKKRVLVLIVIFLAALVLPSLAMSKKPTCPGHPSCGDDPPDGEDPNVTRPAFAYYCKSNPNSGAICLANEDGSAPVEIFKTTKFQGDDFSISAFQGDTSGSVLVIDSFDLYRIDYALEDGLFTEIISQQKVIDADISGHVHAIDWNPSGTGFAYVLNDNIYLAGESRAVLEVPENTDQGIFALSWGAVEDHLYFIRLVIDSTTDETLTEWQLRRLNISDAAERPLQVSETKCLFASNERVDDDCPATHAELWHLKDVSVVASPGYGEEVLVSAVVVGTGGYVTGFETFLVIDDADTSTISIPNFRGRDWTPGLTIIGESDDGKLVEFVPPDGNSRVLIKKNATSADWVN